MKLPSIFNWQLFNQQLFNGWPCLAIVLGCALCGSLWLGWATPALAQSPNAQPASPSDLSNPASMTGKALFEQNCTACHAGGGNIVRRGKNLKKRALTRNGYTDVGAIARLISQGKSAMPAYADRLSPGEIEAIAQYVLQQAEAGW